MKLKPIIFLLCCGIFSISAANDSFEAQREKILNRKRTVIYNTDGCDISYFPENMELTKENFLSRRMVYNIGSDVDTISFCGIITSLGSIACDLESTELFTSQEFEIHVKNSRNIAPELKAMGTDAMTWIQEHCRKHNKEFFISIRMNDTHDSPGTFKKPHYLMSKFKQENPDTLFGTPDPSGRPPFCSWTAFDYENPKVRQLFINIFKELLEKYDADGIELDFMRHAQLFKTVAWGEKATQKQLDLMTDFMKEVREVAETAGRKRGRPFLIAIRVPDSVEYCKAIGIDLEKWLESNCADILITSSYFQFNPWQTSVDLAKKYNVKFYASLDESRIREKFLPLANRNSDDSYFARVSRVMASGADGVYFFNKEGQGVKKVMTTDIKRLQEHNKVYYLRVRGSGGYLPDFYLRNGDRFNNLPNLEPHEPKIITIEDPYKFSLFIGDDLSHPEVKLLNPQVTAHIAADAPENAKLYLKLNGKKFSTNRNKNIFSADIPAELLKKGDNYFEICIDDTIEIPLTQEQELCRGDLLLTGKDQKLWRRLFNGVPSLAELIINKSLRINDYADDVIPNFAHPLPKRKGIFSTSFSMKNGSDNDKETSVFRVAADEKIEIVIFESDKITFKFAGKSVKFNTVDKFHEYTLSSDDGKTITLKADGQELMSAAFSKSTDKVNKNLVNNAWSTPWMDSNSILFGSLSMKGKGYSDWKNISVVDGSVVARDFAVAIKFAKRDADITPFIQEAQKLAKLPGNLVTEIYVKDGKLVTDQKVRIRYENESIKVNGNKIILDHTSTEKPYQHFEVIRDTWQENLTSPLAITWKFREIENSTVSTNCFSVVATLKLKDGYHIMVFRAGKNQIYTPWDSYIEVPGGTANMHEFKVILNPVDGRTFVWIDGKFVSCGITPLNLQKNKSYISIGDGSSSVGGKVELEYIKFELLGNKNTSTASPKKFGEIASVSVKDGKVVFKNVRNRYKENPITVSDNVILLDNTATEKPATFQHFEVLVDDYLKNLTNPIVISWEAADLKSSEDARGSFQFACIPNVPKKGYFDFGFTIGHGKIITPWGKEISLPGEADAMYKYSAEFNPVTEIGKLWINDKLVSEGKVKNNKSRQRSYFSVGDGSSGISGKAKFRGISVKIINQ